MRAWIERAKWGRGQLDEQGAPETPLAQLRQRPATDGRRGDGRATRRVPLVVHACHLRTVWSGADVELYTTRPTVVRPSMRWRLPIRGIPGLNELSAFMR